MATCGGPPSGYSATPADPSGYSGTFSPSYCDPCGNPHYNYDPYRMPPSDSAPATKSDEELQAEQAEKKAKLDEILGRLYDYSLDHGKESPDALKGLLEGYAELTGKDKPGFMI